MNREENKLDDKSGSFLQDMLNIFSKQVSPSILIVDKNCIKMNNGCMEVRNVSPELESQLINQIQNRIKKLMGERTLESLMNQLYTDLRKY